MTTKKKNDFLRRSTGAVGFGRGARARSAKTHGRDFFAAVAIAQRDLQLPSIGLILLPLMFLLGALMVSNVRYRSFKDFDLRHKRSFFQLVILVTIVAIAAVRTEVTLLALFGYYILLGLVQELGVWVRKSFGRKTEPAQHLGKEES